MVGAVVWCARGRVASAHVTCPVAFGLIGGHYGEPLLWVMEIGLLGNFGPQGPHDLWQSYGWGGSVRG